jgi:hypothetical protein
MITLTHIAEAVRIHSAIDVNSPIPFRGDVDYEDQPYFPQMLFVGLADQHGIHHTETCKLLCIEDVEYNSLLVRFRKYLDNGARLVKCGIRITDRQNGGGPTADSFDFRSIRTYHRYAMIRRYLKYKTEKTFFFKTNGRKNHYGI